MSFLLGIDNEICVSHFLIFKIKNNTWDNTKNLKELNEIGQNFPAPQNKHFMIGAMKRGSRISFTAVEII